MLGAVPGYGSPRRPAQKADSGIIGITRTIRPTGPGSARNRPRPGPVRYWTPPAPVHPHHPAHRSGSWPRATTRTATTRDAHRPAHGGTGDDERQGNGTPVPPAGAGPRLARRDGPGDLLDVGRDPGG